MPRVLHVLDHSLPLHSGYSFRSQNIILSRRGRGDHVAAVTSSRHERSWKRETTAVEEIGGIRYYRSGPERRIRIPFVDEALLVEALARKVEEAAGAERPELLHAHSPALTALAALRAGKRLGVPVVYEIRAFWEDAAVDHGTYREGSWKYRLTRGVETWACRRVSEVAVLCGGLKEDLAARGIPRERMTIAPNGIDPHGFGTVDPDEEFRRSWRLGGSSVVAFLGSFYRYEGLDLLVQAFDALRSRVPNVKLLLVGGGEVEGELREQVARSALGDSVVFAGRVPHERVPGVYALADVLVYPRYSMRLTELVTPLKPLEAMAMGKALIASDVGGHRELIEDGRTGLLFRAGNVDALEDALGRILLDPDQGRRIGMAGRSWVRQSRTWEQTASVYDAIYARVLQRASGSARALPAPS